MILRKPKFFGGKSTKTGIAVVEERRTKAVMDPHENRREGSPSSKAAYHWTITGFSITC